MREIGAMLHWEWKSVFVGRSSCASTPPLEEGCWSSETLQEHAPHIGAHDARCGGPTAPQRPRQKRLCVSRIFHPTAAPPLGHSNFARRCTCTPWVSLQNLVAFAYVLIELKAAQSGAGASRCPARLHRDSKVSRLPPVCASECALHFRNLHCWISVHIRRDIGGFRRCLFTGISVVTAPNIEIIGKSDPSWSRLYLKLPVALPCTCCSCQHFLRKFKITFHQVHCLYYVNKPKVINCKAKSNKEN
jgi:hypothetical protein